MTELVLVGGEVITPREARFTSVTVEAGVVTSLQDHFTKKPDRILDVSDCYVTPGLIDLQVNGAAACNFWADPTEAEVQAICRRMLESGVTCFLPTLITDDLEHMNKNISFLQALGVGADEPVFGVRLPGLHLEGPCLSPQRPGVHPPQYLQPLSKDVLQKIVRDPVRLITAALELDPSGEVLDWLQKKNVTVSLGHSNASFEQAKTAFARGVRLMTHTFNALPPLHHRSLGAVGAAMLDERVSCCVICDGLHVNPDAVRLLVKLKGAQGCVLVTDIAHVGTAGGGLVGSSIYLDEAVRNVIDWGIASFRDAILMATHNAAEAVGLEEKYGTIAAGRQADLVVWERKTLAIKHVIVAGKLVLSRETALKIP